MRRTALTCLALFALALGSLRLLAADGHDGWLISYKEALEQSKKTGRPVLADFTGSDWCGWCIKLKKEVFDTDEFKKWAAANVILLELDFPHGKKQSPEIKKQNEELSDKYDIQGFPTILFLDHTGKKLAESGYIQGGPSKWIPDAKKKLGKHES